MASYNFDFTSTGGPAIESQIKSILNGAKATSSEILALSRALGVSAQQAAAFAAKIGLGVGETAAVAQKLKQLQAAGLSTAQAYKVLQRENGITIKQFRELNTGLKSVTKEQENYAAQTRQSSEASAAQVLALQQVNAAAQRAAAQLQGLASSAIGEFIQYDDALTSVAAKAGVAKDQLGFLEQAVLETALATSQSPVSAVKAADSLIALGASAEEAASNVKTVAQLTDALRTVGADAETAAKVIQLGTSIFEEFGVSAEDVGDRIALISDTSAVASSTGLQEFLQLFSKAGGIAAQLDVDLDELLANFATLRDAGQAPEVAATSLKSLLSTVLASREKLEDLGLTVFDVNDEFVGLTNIFQQLSERGTSATELVELFGKIGVASATALTENYEDTIAATDRLAGAQGNLQAKSDVINSSIQGQVTLLQGSLQTALVELGEVLGQFTGPAVGNLLSLVNAFLDAPPAIKVFVAALIGGSAAIATAVASVTGLVLALKALEAAQVGATVKTAAATVATNAQTVATVATTLATKQYTLAQAAAAIKTGAATGVTVGYTAATTALGVALKGLLATLSALGPALAVLGAGLAVGDIIKTRNELSNLNEQVAVLGDANKATFDASLKVAQGLKNVNDEILSLREQDLDVSDELLEKQRQYVALSQQSLADVEREIAVRQELIQEIEAAQKGQTDVPFLAGQTADAQEAILNNLSAQVGELEVARRLLTTQVEVTNEIADATGETADNAEAAADAFKEAQDALERVSDEISIDMLRQQREAYDTLGRDKEALERRLGQIEEDELVRRLNAQRQYLADIRDATFESEEEKEAAIADAAQEVASIELDLAKMRADIRQEEQQRIDESYQEQVNLAEEAAEAKAKAEADRIALERAQRAAAFAEQRRELELAAQLQQQYTDERIRQQERIIDAYDDELDALQNQLEQIQLNAEARQISIDRTIQESQIRSDGLQRAASLLQILNDEEEDTRETRKLAEQELRRLGIDRQTTQLKLLDKIQKEEETRRKAEFEALQLQQQQERVSLAIQQEQERVALRRAAVEAQIGVIKAQQLAVETQIAAITAQVDVQEAAAALADAQQDGDQEAILQAQGQLDLAQQSAALLAQQVPIAQQNVELANEQALSAQDELRSYQSIAEQQTQNLLNQQQLTLETEKSADAAERLAAALERAALAGTPEADVIVGTEPAARRFGGPVEPGQVYRVNEAGVEAFRPKGSNQVMPLLQPRNSLFSPSVPGQVLSVPQVNRLQQQGVNLAGLQAEVKGLRADLASRPVPTLSAPATFVNEPSPLATQIQLLNAQLKAARGVL